MNNDILQRYIEGNATQEEKEAIARWLDADERNMQEFLLLRNVYDTTIWHKEGKSKLTLSKHFAENGRSNRRVKLIKEFAKVAAVFLIALGSYHLFVFPQLKIENAVEQMVYAPEGQRAEVTLADGTKVWLNAKSSLVFPNQFEGEERIVELEGEAYFDVTHDEEKKFIVKTDQYDIKVYGTEFNVNAYRESEQFETALLKGSVEIISNTTEERVMLSPNNRVYKDNGKLVSDAIKNQDQFLWREGVLFFDNKKVGDLLKDLELYYGVEIEVKKPELLSHQYTGKFWTKDGVEHVLRVLQLRHRFKYSKDGMNKITIY